MENTLEYWFSKAAELKGDFAEIGLGLGETTKILLGIASKCGKTVWGVDPFESGWSEMPEGYAKPYKEADFIANVTPYLQNVDFVLLRSNSLSKEAEAFLNKPLALAFVDGLQYKGAVLSDLRIVSHAEIIVVDDFDRSTGMSQVPEAIEEWLKTNKRTLIDLGRHAVLIK